MFLRYMALTAAPCCTQWHTKERRDTADLSLLNWCPQNTRRTGAGIALLHPRLRLLLTLLRFGENISDSMSYICLNSSICMQSC